MVGGAQASIQVTFASVKIAQTQQAVVIPLFPGSVWYAAWGAKIPRVWLSSVPIGLTGKTGGTLRDVVDHCISVPRDQTLRIQEATS
jgi:hypothetical protein